MGESLDLGHTAPLRTLPVNSANTSSTQEEQTVPASLLRQEPGCGRRVCGTVRPPAAHARASRMPHAHARTRTRMLRARKRKLRGKTHHLAGADGGAALGGGALQRKCRQGRNQERAHDGHND